MSGSSNSFANKLLNNVFPRMPDFYGMINEQCDVAVETMEALLVFMANPSKENSDRVCALEDKGDHLKRRNWDALGKAFATPMDREDIHRAINSIDVVINYGEIVVKEMDALGIRPDSHMVEMSQLLLDGARQLQRGFAKLATKPASADEDALKCAHTEPNAAIIYRKALSQLLNVDDHIAAIKASGSQEAQAAAMQEVVDMFKHREIYRDLLDSAEHLSMAGNVLHDIVVQIS